MSYPALLTAERVCGFVVRFRDVPEALATGPDRESALAAAGQALATALGRYVVTGRPLPDPSPLEEGEEMIEADVRPEPDCQPVGHRARSLRRRARPWRRASGPAAGLAAS